MGRSLTVKVSPEFYRRLKALRAEALEDLRGLVGTEAAAVLAQSQILVPRGEGSLASSTFLDGPEVDTKKHSIGATCGYTAEHASAVHEGFHWSTKRVKAPSNFLRIPAAGRRRPFKHVVAKQLTATINRINPR